MPETPPLPLDDPTRLPPDAARFPATCWLSLDDALRVTSWNAATGVTLTVEGRFLTRNGDVKAFARTHTPNTDRTAASTVFALGEGWLLNVQVRASVGTPRIGQCFALLELVRGTASLQTPIGTLAQGYVTATSRRTWPGSPLEASTAGPGVVRSITGTDPAAAAEISEMVPTGARWRLISVFAVLVTDANAANRDAALTLDDGTTVFARIPGGQNDIAAQTTRFNWTLGGVRFTIAQDRTMTPGLPDVYLLAGHRLATVTANIQVGDNWGAPQLLVEEWIEVP